MRILRVGRATDRISGLLGTPVSTDRSDAQFPPGKWASLYNNVKNIPTEIQSDSTEPSERFQPAQAAENVRLPERRHKST